MMNNLERGGYGMIAWSLIGVLCGAVLGLRFKVILLVPLVLLAGTGAAGAAAAGWLPISQACADLLGWSLGLELAYGAIVGVAVARRARTR